MHYSLVSSSVLGFDLVRLPGGPAVAEVLLRALAAGPDELAVLAAHEDAGARDRTWEAVHSAGATLRGAQDVLAQLAVDLEAGSGGEDGTLRVLRSSPLADTDALVRLVHHDVLDWTWTQVGAVAVRTEAAARAADVLADAAVAAYLSTSLAPQVLQVLRAPYLAALDELGPLAPERGADDHDLPAQVLGTLDRLARLTGPDRVRLRAASDADRAAGQWSLAAHDASWAVHLSGRTRCAAAAQLRAVGAFRAGGLEAADGAAGVWNVVSGHVHAQLVADLLGDESQDVLSGPWAAAFPRA